MKGLIFDFNLIKWTAFKFNSNVTKTYIYNNHNNNKSNNNNNNNNHNNNNKNNNNNNNNKKLKYILKNKYVNNKFIINHKK